MFKYETIDYYAVDHAPGYLRESATRSISAALIVYIPTVLAGRDAWQQNETIRQAINIDGGMIQNNSILSFKNASRTNPMRTSNQLVMPSRIRLPDNYLQPTHLMCAAEASARIQ